MEAAEPLLEEGGGGGGTSRRNSMAGLIRGAPTAHGFFYALLFAGNVLCNKYVLSELEFTYPTIFQGWQVLVGACFLKGLSFCGGSSSVVNTALDKPGFISLLPNFLLFVGALVAGSKALAFLDVPQFVACANLSPALVYLFDAAPKFRKASWTGTLACVAVVGTTVAVVLLELEMTLFSDSPYFWMLVFVLCSSVHVVHGRIADARFEPVDRLYYSYLVGVCLLAPASLYLDEAFQVSQALKFARNSRYYFFLGCLASGFFGVTSSYIAAQMTSPVAVSGGGGGGDDTYRTYHAPSPASSRSFGFFLNAAKSLCAVVGCLAFVGKSAASPGRVLSCVAVNLAAGFFIPLPTDPTAAGAEWSGFQPLSVVRTVKGVV